MSKYPTLTYEELIALNPCKDELKIVTKLLGGPQKWRGKKIDARQAVRAGVSFKDLLWAAVAKASNDEDVARRLQYWADDRSIHVLKNYEAWKPSDPSVRDAIIASRAFKRGGITWDELMAAARAARAAARAAAEPAAARAAWAAARAAAEPAAESVAREVRAPAWAAARRWAITAAEDRWQLGRAEEQWQLDRLVQWLTDEPKPLRLPPRPKEQRGSAA